MISKEKVKNVHLNRGNSAGLSGYYYYMLLLSLCI